MYCRKLKISFYDLGKGNLKTRKMKKIGKLTVSDKICAKCSGGGGYPFWKDRQKIWF
jgi:hypothetical protein